MNPDNVLQDRYGKNISIGTKVIYSDYAKNASLFVGEVIKITKRTVVISRHPNYDYWKRVVKIVNVGYDLIVTP